MTPGPAASRLAQRADVPRRIAREVVGLLGLPFDTLGLATVVETLREAAFSNRRCIVCTPNVNFIVAARADAAFRDAVLRSDLSLPDGAPVVWAARWLALPIRERVAGANVFDALRAHRGEPLGVFFFGGPPGVAERACRRLNEAAGGLRGVGHDEAGFGTLDEMSTPERIARINGSGAHFIVVALGARKGHAWIERNAPLLAAPLLCHLGAVVNFVAGEVGRAPVWMQRAGLEWAWRIGAEPQLWRRYASDGLALAGLVITRLLPLAWRTRTRSGAGEPPTLESTRPEPRLLAIRLGGCWTQPALGPLRALIVEAIDRGDAVAIELVDLVADFDAHFVGLLLIARGELGAARLRLHGAASRARARLRSHGAEFLLSDDGEVRS